MAVHTAKKGLDLPITGGPEQSVSKGPKVRSVAVVAADFHGMKPRMAVKVGADVKRGQKLFEDRKQPGVFFTAPGAGRVTAVHRGEYRALQSVVIELSDAERDGDFPKGEQVEFEHYAGKAPAKMSRDEVVALLVESGLWTYLRTRPFSRTPSPEADAPPGIFITASDSAPLAGDVDRCVKGHEDDLQAGVEVIAKLVADKGKVFFCRKAGSKVAPKSAPKNVETHDFAGPHPSGTVGFHIHTLMPVNRARSVWHLNVQQVITIGHLVRTGQLAERRVVALAGPQVSKPRLLRTRRGACLAELLEGELESGENRVVDGSVLSGRKAVGEPHQYLGAHRNQISVLREGREREFLGWLTLGLDRFSTSGIYLSQLTPAKKFDFTTTTNGSKRAMVPIGMYERVFPFDILPTFLLRSLLVNDLTRAEELGALELDEEDLALCTFVCPGKHDYGAVLRHNLETIWKEG